MSYTDGKIHMFIKLLIKEERTELQFQVRKKTSACLCLFCLCLAVCSESFHRRVPYEGPERVFPCASL